MTSSLKFTLIVGTLLSIASSAILLYISIATMIGPWIAPTLVLISSMLVTAFNQRNENTPKQLILISSLASGGGIIAVGIGFSLPMLYFLAPESFQDLMASPSYFITRIMVTIMMAGSFGLFIGKFIAKSILKKTDLAFPISQMAHQIATTQSHTKDSKSLFSGILATLFLCFSRDGFYLFKGLFNKDLIIFNNALVGPLIFSFWPTLWAIGFTVGLASTIPLLVGLIARYIVLYPINFHSAFLPFSLFSPLPEESFITAFCAGMILSDLIISMLQNPKQVAHYIQSYIKNLQGNARALVFMFFKKPFHLFYSDTNKLEMLSKSFSGIEPLIGLGGFFAFFTILDFSIAAQLTIFVAMCIALYEINRLCGKIGLLQIGRFSAFILIPAVVIFKINPLQMTALTIFFNVAAAVSSDLLFDYKAAQLGNVNRTMVYNLQWLGLFISSITIAVVCYLLFSNLTLGSAELFAHRGRTKALLLQSLNFDIYIITAGFLFGWLLKRFKISPTMAFGGMIMPSQIAIGFVFGGLLSKIAGNKKNLLLPFCSGVFATETLWLLLSLSLRFTK